MTPTQPILVTAVIVNYNARDFLKVCLNSLAQEATEIALEIIVIDNASSDNSENAIARSPVPVQFVRNPRNIGLARANNQGLRMAKGKYLLFMNPDVEVLPGCLTRLARFLDDHPDSGIVGPKLLNPDRSLQYSCREFYTLPTLLLRRSFLGRIPPARNLVQRHLMTSWDHACTREVDWLLGAFMMVRREAVENVGMMDERFFLYFEDVDWCYRMKRSGWKVYYHPDAEAVHYHYRHSARKGYKQQRDFHLGSLFKFVSKYGGFIGRHSNYPANNKSQKTTRSTLTSRSWSLVFGLLSLGTDLILASVLFWLAYILRVFLKPWPVPDYLSYFRLWWMSLGSLSLSLFFSGYYRNASRLPIFHQIRLTISSILFAGLLVLALLFLLRGLAFSRLIIIFFWTILFPTLLIGRFFLYKLNLKAFNIGYGRLRTWIYGTGKESQELYERFLETPELGCDIVGFLNDLSHGEQGSYGGLPIWSSDPKNLKSRLLIDEIDQIIIPGMHPSAKVELRPLIDFCMEHNVILRLVHPQTDYLATQARLFDIIGVSLVGQQSPLERPLAQIWKRIFDLLLSFLLFPFVVLLTACFALVFKLQRVQKMTFTNLIVGRGCRLVKIHQSTNPNWLTPFHSYLLFQLLDVILGTMSLVGPRPMSEKEAASLSEWEKRRFNISPGLTGLEQVRSPWMFSTKDRVLLDLYYIENWSTLLDLEILLEAIGSMILKPWKYLRTEKIRVRS